jgi:hypothetical protein
MDQPLINSFWMYVENYLNLEPIMHRGPSALFCLTLSAVLLVAPSLNNIGDHSLYSSAWAKDGGGRGGGNGNGGNGGGGNGGGSSGSDNAGNSNSGKSASSITGAAKSKSSALNPTTASISKANAAVARAQKALVEAMQALEKALATSGTNTNTFLRLEYAVTAAEKSLRKASVKAAALDNIVN